MEVALWEWDFDVVFPEGFPDGEEDFRADVFDALGCVVDPEADLQVDGGVPEADEQAVWRGVLEDAGDFGGYFFADADGLFDVCGVGDADVCLDAVRMELIQP